MALLVSLVLFYLMNHGLVEAAYYCYPTTGTFPDGSAYQTNRDADLYDMSTDVSNAGGYQYYGPSQQTTAVVYCLGLCRLDIVASNTDVCSRCISHSVFIVTTSCRFYKEVIAWGDDAGCLVRCSPHQFLQTYETQPTFHSCNSSNVSTNIRPQFGLVLGNLTKSIAKKAAVDGSLSSFSSGANLPKYFAVEESKVNDTQSIYASGFCLPTLSQSSCTACLLAAANQSERSCNEKQGATIFSPSCVLRYELYRFYNQSTYVAPLPSPSPRRSSHRASSPLKKRKENGGFRAKAIILPVIAVLSLIVLMICIIKVMRKRKQKNSDQNGTVGEDGMEFSLNAIRTATNNFSTHNKLGQGGFGVVYQGRLPNGRQIAVKRLALISGRAEVEFKNEVRVVAKLHHKNLIRLLGFCFQGGERILVYELALNGSLDRFIFDPTKRQLLTWEIRYNIIEGIARGILYLHEESQLKIIHRDLKPSNILLDEHMTPKISDFGTARLFFDEQSSASKIVGTYGYMSPEYVKHGKVSIKIDVFSFGVLSLEILCGKRNNASGDSKHLDHLLSKAWKYWATGELHKLIDPILLKTSDQINEMTQCIHIALLCVQHDAVHRPTMNAVILMLEGRSESFPPPSKPAYYIDTEEVELLEITMIQENSKSQVTESEASSSQQTRDLSLRTIGLSSSADSSFTRFLEPR